MALTANVMHGEPQRCRAAGMDDFAAKPTTIPLLAAKLREWLPPRPFPHPVRRPGRLDELSRGDAALAAAILGDSVESTTPDVTRLGEALEARELDEVRRQAHRLKGGERGGGGAAIAARLEAEAGDGDGLRARGAELAMAVPAVAEEVASEASAPREEVAEPRAEARVRGYRGSGRRGELGDDGAAVDPHLLAADEAVAEVEDVEDSEGHPAAVAGDAEHLADHRAGHRLLEDHRVAGEEPVQRLLLLLGAEVGGEEDVELPRRALARTG